jgi:AcrR family transcriptional regulator
MREAGSGAEGRGADGTAAARGLPAAPNDQGQAGPKLERLLAAAAALIARQGYGQTTIRDVARETGFSLAGMYYYFENKEDLLYKIQLRTFASLLAEQEQIAARDGEAEARLRGLVQNHLVYFAHHFNELKICAFELETLGGERYREVEALRRRYYQLLAGVIEQVVGAGAAPGKQLVRHHSLFVFGMLNWIFMWYDPGRDGPVAGIGEEMLSFILHGLSGGRGTGPS